MRQLLFILTLFLYSLISCNEQTNSLSIPITYTDTNKFFRKEIPTNDLFYLLAKDKQRQLGLDSLENGFTNLQIRIWYDFSRVLDRKLIVITNKDTSWTATIYNLKVYWDGQTETIQSKNIRQSIPKSGWASFSKKILSLNIMTLPDRNEMNGYDSDKDGTTYNIEVASKNQYRFYAYWEPEVYQNKYWQAKNMTDILKLLEAEFGI